ncbi:hypothetical protein EVAR_11388_1 [Eumeta japonica]|uniref:Uncharacterized protein n=1 Tax=Eumeta variegata TaxID=151549 RepID=A0A4C1TNC3_EUMVA|nr:hypothetical protein EVAR_11388_1 [Eumeta japonica]
MLAALSRRMATASSPTIRVVRKLKCVRDLDRNRRPTDNVIEGMVTQKLTRTTFFVFILHISNTYRTLIASECGHTHARLARSLQARHYDMPSRPAAGPRDSDSHMPHTASEIRLTVLLRSQYYIQ